MGEPRLFPSRRSVRDREEMLVERSDVLDRLAGTPLRVGEAARLTDAADAALDGPPPGEWSAREIVGHLVAVETAVWQVRLDSLDASATAKGEEPAWAWTEPGVTERPEAATLDGALRLLATLRAATVARVAALDDAGWARTGVHATYGRLDVAGLLRVAADHDDEHLATLDARRLD